MLGCNFSGRNLKPKIYLRIQTKFVSECKQATVMSKVIVSDLSNKSVNYARLTEMKTVNIRSWRPIKVRLHNIHHRVVCFETARAYLAKRVILKLTL